ncbi:MAG: hypothetical protein Rhirs2KO_09830 [Rhizobiaceae bacterium]
MKTLAIAPMDGLHHAAELNRARVAADLRDRRLTCAAWALAAAAFAVLGWQLFDYLAEINAALASAGRV